MLLFPGGRRFASIKLHTMEEGRCKEYAFNYTNKDLILYALAIGMGAQQEDAAADQRFLYEGHPQFSPVPSFCLSFTFWSNKKNAGNTTGRIPPFPPPLMADEELIPGRFLQEDVDPTAFPMIHTWQSIVWDRQLPIPSGNDQSVGTTMNLKTIMVQPKSIGTFVTTQSKIMVRIPGSGRDSSLCTMQSTGLVLGISRDAVAPYESGDAKATSKPIIPEDDPPILEWTFETSASQALLYRVASGDSNHIHVDNSASEMMQSAKKAPLLHGLFTMAVAFRGLLRVVPDADLRIHKLEAKFSLPAFVGDVLLVKIWKSKKNPGQFLFIVANKTTGGILVDKGSAVLKDKPSGTKSTNLGNMNSLARPRL